MAPGGRPAPAGRHEGVRVDTSALQPRTQVEEPRPTYKVTVTKLQLSLSGEGEDGGGREGEVSPPELVLGNPPNSTLRCG